MSLADLFGINVPAVSKHLANIFEAGELDPVSTVSKMEIVRLEGGRSVSREVEHYNLDVILSVGYRVSSVILCEQFLLYAESRAIRGRSMTMDDLAAKLDELLKTNDYAVFTGYRDFLKDRAMEHAEAEWGRFQKMLADGTHLPVA